MTQGTDWSLPHASDCQGSFSILINAPSYNSFDPSHLLTSLTIWLLSVYFGSIYRSIGLVVMHPASEGG